MSPFFNYEPAINTHAAIRLPYGRRRTASSHADDDDPSAPFSHELIYTEYMKYPSTFCIASAVGAIALALSLSVCAATIHEAVRTGNAQEVNRLISADSGVVNAVNELGSTPLHIAAGISSPDIAGLLLNKGAAVNAKDHDGATPLHIAAFTRHKATLELLLAKGADVHATDNNGKTARDYAETSLDREISAILLLRMLATPAVQK